MDAAFRNADRNNHFNFTGRHLDARFTGTLTRLYLIGKRELGNDVDSLVERVIEQDSMPFVYHMGRQLLQGLTQSFPELSFHRHLVQGLIHAEHPLVAFSRADRKRKMAGAQTRMAILLNEQIRAAQPAGQILEQFIPGSSQAFLMHGSDAGRLR